MLTLLLCLTTQLLQSQLGSAAELAANRKQDKYVDVVKNHLFVPSAIENLGPFWSEGKPFLTEHNHRMTMATGDICETAQPV